VSALVDLSQGGSSAPRYKQSNGAPDVYVLAAIDLHLRIYGLNGDRESFHAPVETRLDRRSGAIAERRRLAAKALKLKRPSGLAPIFLGAVSYRSTFAVKT
jgi:hypothetical protein